MFLIPPMLKGICLILYLHFQVVLYTFLLSISQTIMQLVSGSVVMSHLQLYHLYLVIFWIVVMQIKIAFLLTYSNLILVLCTTVVI